MATKIAGLALATAVAALPSRHLPANPQQPDLFEQARVSLTYDDTLAALQALERLTEAEPDFAAGWGWLGMLLTDWTTTAREDVGERRRAEKALRRALKLDHENPLYLYMLGVLTRKQGFRVDSDRLIERALRIVDENPERLDPIESAQLNLMRRLAKRRTLLAQQAALEQLRRELLPTRQMPLHCQEAVDRICLAWEPQAMREQAEPDSVRVERDRLIESLRVAAASLPEPDEWIATQLVRYLMEAGRHEEALEVVTTCGLRQPWRCTALAGYIHQTLGAYELADSVFAAALDRMPEDMRRWMNDITPILDDPSALRYDLGSAAARDSVIRRFWWLADPLYLTPCNDRHTEHLARRVVGLMQTDAQSVYGVEWGRDLDEVIARYGWPVGWVKVPKERYFEDEIVSYYAPYSRRFVPPARYISDPTSIPANTWLFDLSNPYGTYAPRYVTSFRSLEHQLAIFQRVDSVELVVAFDQSADVAWATARGEAGLFLIPDELSTPTVLRQPSGPRGNFRLTVPADPALLSLELFSDSEGLAARARYGLPLRRLPYSVLAVSSLLVTQPAELLPETLDRAAPLALGSLRVQRGERLGLYWEVYRLGETPEPLNVWLIAGKLDEQGRIITDAEGVPISLRWQDVAPAKQPVWSRSLTVDLPPDLEPGRYLFLLQITAPRREPVRQARVFLVER